MDGGMQVIQKMMSAYLMHTPHGATLSIRISSVEEKRKMKKNERGVVLDSLVGETRQSVSRGRAV